MRFQHVFDTPELYVAACLNLKVPEGSENQIYSHKLFVTDYRRPLRKLPSLHSPKSTPTPKFLGTAKAYFVCHIGQNFQISLIYAFIGCP
jgi:hypothetical protein